VHAHLNESQTAAVGFKTSVKFSRSTGGRLS
jgi:hypothetical protein